MKREDAAVLLSNYEIDAPCPNCKIERCKLVINIKKDGWMICPQCGYELDVYGMKGLQAVVDEDEHSPVLITLDEEKPLSLEEKEANEIKKHGGRVIRVKRL